MLVTVANPFIVLVVESDGHLFKIPAEGATESNVARCCTYGDYSKLN